MSGGRSQTGGLGWVLAAGAFGVLGIVLGNLRYDVNGVDASFLGHFLGLPPNEMGDALAGIFGSLAFLVAAGAIYLQSRELAAQREELRLTREVMEEQRIAATDMAASMKVQAAIFEQEQKEREESRADRELEALFDELDSCLVYEYSGKFQWFFEEVPTSPARRKDYYRMFSAALNNDVFGDARLMQRFHDLIESVKKIEEDLRFGGLVAPIPSREDFTKLNLLLLHMQTLKVNASPAMLSRLRMMNFDEAVDCVATFYKTPNAWAAND